MNYDQDTWREFAGLLQETKQRFSVGSQLAVYPHQINQEYAEPDVEAIESWINDMNVALRDLACEAGMYHRKKSELPSLTYEMCGAANGRWFVIRPDGNICCCGEQLQDDQIIGSIGQGLNNAVFIQDWKQFADYDRCKECALFPQCARLKKCQVKSRCIHKKESMNQYNKTICELIDSRIDEYKDLRGGKRDGIQ